MRIKIYVSNVMYFKKNIMEANVKHCDICQKCVQNFDHHCYYINNCVGSQNLVSFFFFIVLFIISLIFQAVIQFSILFHILEYNEKFNIFFLIFKIKVFNNVKFNYCVIMIYTILIVFMIFSLFFLLKNVLKSILTGKSYYHRIKKMKEDEEETIRLNKL